MSKIILVNGKEHKVDSDYLGYSQVCLLAGFYSREDVTITYGNSLAIPPHGILHLGEAIRIQNGTDFSVALNEVLGKYQNSYDKSWE